MSSTVKTILVALVAFALGFLSHQLLTAGASKPSGPAGLSWEVEGESLRLSSTEPGKVLIGWGDGGRVDPENRSLIAGRDDSFTIASVYRVRNGRVEPYIPCEGEPRAAFCTPVEEEPLVLECGSIGGPQDGPYCVVKPVPVDPLPRRLPQR